MRQTMGLVAGTKMQVGATDYKNKFPRLLFSVKVKHHWPADAASSKLHSKWA